MAITCSAPEFQAAIGGAGVAALIAGAWSGTPAPFYTVGACGVLFAAVCAAKTLVSEAPQRRERAAEMRGFGRLAAAFTATLDWNDDEGRSRSVQVDVLDISAGGAAVRSKQPFSAGSAVFVNIKSQCLMGVGHVRHCTPRGRRYAVGLEFRSPLMSSERGNWTVCHRTQSS